MTDFGNRGSGLAATCLIAILMLTACGGSLPPPDWQLNARGGIEAYDKHYLSGDTRLAEFNQAKARSAIAASGRLDILARAELARCAARTAALAFDECPAYRALESDAAPPERAYARFLAADWSGLDAKTLPPHYGALVGARDDSARLDALRAIKDPLPRLIGAGLLFRQTDLPPEGIALAIDTASERGWRRPLLAWLRVAERRAEAGGDGDALAALRRRIALVLSVKPPMSE